jgi:hypothetical protein
MAVGKTLRHAILKRDDFKCKYCGKDSDDAKLEIDHIIPVAKGGDDNPINLVTACFDCNRGKRDTLLGHKQTFINKEELEKEFSTTRDNVQKYYIQKQFKEEAMDIILNAWNENFNQNIEDSQMKSLKHFAKMLPPHEIVDAIEVASNRWNGRMYNAPFKYLCGILHNKRKSQYEALLPSSLIEQFEEIQIKWDKLQSILSPIIDTVSNDGPDFNKEVFFASNDLTESMNAYIDLIPDQEKGAGDV